MPTTTALLRTASNLRQQIAAYQDRQAAIEFSSGLPTDSSTAAYLDYLQKRADELQSAGGVSNLSTAMTLMERAKSAQSQNISFNVTVATNQVLYGGAPPTTRLQAYQIGYSRAIAIGDQDLALRMDEGVASTNQQIQLENQTAIDKMIATGKRNANDASASYTALASNLKKSLATFNEDYINAGQGRANKLLGKFVQNLRDSLSQSYGPNSDIVAQLDQAIADKVQPNYFDVVSGVSLMIQTAEMSAAQVLQPVDPVKAQDLFETATASVGKIDTIFGTMNIDQVNSASNSPNSFSLALDPDFVSPNSQNGSGGQQNPITGYQVGFITNGGKIADTTINPIFSSTTSVETPKDTADKLAKLGLSVTSTKGNTFEVAGTNQTPDWLKQVLPPNSITHIIADNNGNLQFEATDTGNRAGGSKLAQFNKSIFTLTPGGQFFMSNGLEDRILFDPNRPEITPQTASSFAPLVKGAAPPATQQAIRARLGTPVVHGAGVNPKINQVFQPTTNSTRGPSMAQKSNGGGFAFTNNGQAISAAQYAKLTNTPFRTLLQQMSNKGDSGAKQALNFVGNDFGYDPTKINNGNNASLYNALVWGTGKSAPELKANIQNGHLTLPSGFQF